MPWGYAAIAAATVGGALISSSASKSAAKTEATASNQASTQELDMFNQTQANEAPFVAAGGNALPALQSGVGIGPGGTGTGPLNAQYPNMAPFTLSDFQTSPGYQFQVQEGENAILNNRSALGGVNSGNTLKALTSYGEGVANQDYWNAYNAYVNNYQQGYANYTNNQNQKFGQLQTLAGSGQNAAANLGALSANTGAAIGNNIIGAGNASAAGTVASGNAINSGVQNLSQNYLLANAISGGNLFGSSSSGPSADQIINSLYPG